MQPVPIARKKKLTQPEVESLVNDLLLPGHSTFDALISFAELINGGPFKHPPKLKAKSLTSWLTENQLAVEISAHLYLLNAIAQKWVPLTSTRSIESVKIQSQLDIFALQ